MDWRHHAVCRDEDPELFFPIGTSGPALLQVEQAKAVCRRCSVTDQCLRVGAGDRSGRRRLGWDERRGAARCQAPWWPAGRPALTRPDPHLHSHPRTHAHRRRIHRRPGATCPQGVLVSRPYLRAHSPRRAGAPRGFSAPPSPRRRRRGACPLRHTGGVRRVDPGQHQTRQLRSVSERRRDRDRAGLPRGRGGRVVEQARREEVGRHRDPPRPGRAQLAPPPLPAVGGAAEAYATAARHSPARRRARPPPARPCRGRPRPGYRPRPAPPRPSPCSPPPGAAAVQPAAARPPVPGAGPSTSVIVTAIRSPSRRAAASAAGMSTRPWYAAVSSSGTSTARAVPRSRQRGQHLGGPGQGVVQVRRVHRHVGAGRGDRPGQRPGGRRRPRIAAAVRDQDDRSDVTNSHPMSLVNGRDRAGHTCRPHSVLSNIAQRPARGSSPALVRRVHGQQPIEP